MLYSPCPNWYSHCKQFGTHRIIIIVLLYSFAYQISCQFLSQWVILFFLSHSHLMYMCKISLLSAGLQAIFIHIIHFCICFACICLLSFVFLSDWMSLCQTACLSPSLSTTAHILPNNNSYTAAEKHWLCIVSTLMIHIILITYIKVSAGLMATWTGHTLSTVHFIHDSANKLFI